MHNKVSELEQGVLRNSIATTAVIALTGVVFGLVSGSQAILFDGLFSLVDGHVQFAVKGALNKRTVSVVVAE